MLPLERSEKVETKKRRHRSSPTRPRPRGRRGHPCDSAPALSRLRGPERPGAQQSWSLHNAYPALWCRRETMSSPMLKQHVGDSMPNPPCASGFQRPGPRCSSHKAELQMGRLRWRRTRATLGHWGLPPFQRLFPAPVSSALWRSVSGKPEKLKLH